MAVPVSAKTKEGIPQLLDMILLISDVEELKADPTIPSRGLIIEARMEPGKGPIAVALVEEGTMSVGEYLVAGRSYAKVKSLVSTNGKTLKDAGPSTPVVISGFKTLPDFGDLFVEVKTEREARAQAEAATDAHTTAGRSEMSSAELLRIISRSDKLQELAIIVKADVQGSLASVIDSLKSIETDEVAVRIVGSNVGVINDNDIHMAKSAGAIIYGFNTSVANNIKRLASRDKVSIRLYNVIYELIDDVKSELSALLAPEIIEKEIGTLEVKGVFKTTRTDIICGGEVKSGKLTTPAQARIKRGKEIIGDAKLKGLKRGPNDATDLIEGEMGGLDLETTSRIELQIGDRLEFYVVETKERTL